MESLVPYTEIFPARASIVRKLLTELTGFLGINSEPQEAVACAFAFEQLHSDRFYSWNPLQWI